jgi:hypothetical protein
MQRKMKKMLEAYPLVISSFTVDHTTKWWYIIYDYFYKGK